MAGDLDVSAATFGTTALLIASTDTIAGATGYGWGTQIANNTGWLYYTFKHAWSAQHITGTPAGIIACAIPIVANTYSWYGHVNSNSTNGTVHLTMDGTVIAEIHGTGTATGSVCGWGTVASQWRSVRMEWTDGTADAGEDFSAMLHFRYGSWVF